MSNFTTTLNSIASTLQSFVTPLAIIALVICGIGYVVAGQRGSEQMKEMFKRIVIGVAIAFGATTIVNWLTSLTTSWTKIPGQG